LTVSGWAAWALVKAMASEAATAVVRIMEGSCWMSVMEWRSSALGCTLVAISEQINRIIRPYMFRKSIKSWTA
jgi:hypothetical protein